MCFGSSKRGEEAIVIRRRERVPSRSHHYYEERAPNPRIIERTSREFRRTKKVHHEEPVNASTRIVKEQRRVSRRYD